MLTMLRLTRVSRAGAVVACALACSAIASAQERQAVAGTTVSLVPLQGFVPATTFAGFGNERLQASVMVAELPIAAHGQLVTLFKDLLVAKEQFARQNVTITALQDIDTAEGKVPLIIGTQRSGGVTYDKWIALFKGAKTVMITVQAPTREPLDAAAVKAMLASVSLGAEPTIADKLNALPFAVQPAPPFRVVETVAGSTVLMTVGERDTDPGLVQPMLIVASQLSGTIAATDRNTLPERLLKQTKDFETAKVEKREPVTFAGVTGVLLSGTHSVAGRTKRFAQYFAIGESGRFIRMMVLADEAAFKELQASIDAIAASVAFKPR